MIQFIDREAYCVDRKEVTRTMVISHFCQKGHNDDMLLLYDEESYVGFIAWDNVLGQMEKEVENWLVNDVIIAGEDLLEQAKDYFLKNAKQRWLMILNQTGQPEAFAYNREPDNIGIEEGINVSLSAMELYPGEVDIRLIYSKVTTIYLHGCNEWTVRLYHIFRKQSLNVLLENKIKWDKCLGIRTEELEIPEYEVCHIWAEPDKTKPGMPSMTVGIIRKLAMVCGCEFVKNMQKNVGGDKIKIIDFPMCLNVKSAEEFYRVNRQIEGISFQAKNELDWKIIVRTSGVAKEKIPCYITENAEKYKNKVQTKLYGNIDAKIIGDGVHVIWLIGPCIVGQQQMRFEESFCYQIYEKVHSYAIDYEVRAVLVSAEDYVKLREVFQSIPLNAKDIVLFLQRGKGLEQIENIYGVNLNLSEFFERRSMQKEWVWDIPMHTTPEGNTAIAQEIFQKIIKPAISDLEQEKDCEIWAGKMLTASAELEVNEWIDKIKRESGFADGLRIGAVVVNCNPFTLGHRYLLETALKGVDCLYIFVVEEDQSFFSFEDRFQMVCEGTSDLENVKVVPSGKFVLSAKTFAEYFEKEYLQEETVDASKDIEIFCRYIAPGLGIKVRFVGEEKTDRVTWQYNRQMEKTLLNNGIDFVEIPRKEYNGKVISASIIRKLVKENSWEDMRYYLPESTRKIIETNFKYAE